MTAREFLLTDPKIEEAVSNGYDIRLEEHEWIEKMELYAHTKQKLNIHGVVRPASASALEGEPLPAEGSAKSVRVGCLICGVEMNADDICFNCALNGYHRA